MVVTPIRIVDKILAQQFSHNFNILIHCLFGDPKIFPYSIRAFFVDFSVFSSALIFNVFSETALFSAE